jgi:hypothetical protein
LHSAAARLHGRWGWRVARKRLQLLGCRLAALQGGGRRWRRRRVGW